MTKTYTIEEAETLLAGIAPWPWEECYNGIVARADDTSTDMERDRSVVVTDGGYYPPEGLTKTFIAQSPEIITSLLAQLKDAREKLGVEEEALEFYGDIKNWDERFVQSSDVDEDFDVSDVIVDTDVEVNEGENGPFLTYGGVRARKALAKIRGKG